MFGTNPNVGLLNPLAGKPVAQKNIGGNTMMVGAKTMGLGQGVGVQPITQKDLNRKNSRMN